MPPISIRVSHIEFDCFSCWSHTRASRAPTMQDGVGLDETRSPRVNSISILIVNSKSYFTCVGSVDKDDELSKLVIPYIDSNIRV